MSTDQADREPLDYAMIQQLQAEVARQIGIEVQRREARGERELSRADEQQLALSLIQTAVADHMQRRVLDGNEVALDRRYDDRVANGVYSAMFGAGELQELLDDQAVENININGADEVWVTYADDPHPRRHRPLAATDEDLIAIIQSQAAHAGINARPWTPATPELDLRLSDGSRLSALMGAGERPSISIRRNRFPQMFLPTLVDLGTLDLRLAHFLQAAVLARLNVMVCGATDAGKTSLLRALINIIPPHERIVTVERAAELGLRRHPDLHPNVVEWEEVLPDAEGRGGVSMARLVQRSLRQDPDRVIVGEVLGPEIVVMLNAMGQGNDGSLSTIHARNSFAALDRIASYAAQAENLSFEVTHSLIAGAVDLIVFIRKNPMMSGVRAVAEIREVTGFDGERVTSSELFVPSPVHGRGERSSVALTDDTRKRLEQVGYNDLGLVRRLMTLYLPGVAAAFIAGGFGGGVVLLAVFIRGVEVNPAKPPGPLQRMSRALRSPALTSRLAASIIVAVFTLVLTRWPVAAVGLGALVLCWPLLFGGQREEQAQILQLEALVMWTESLRDTISARASLEQAISSTANSVPEAIRPPMVRLMGLLHSRVPLERALLALSADLNDASADKVIGALILNARQRGTGLASVLTALAKSAREELDQRRRVSAGRSSMRRSVQLVVIITLVLAVFLAVAARTYVAPYDSLGGQVTLAVVVGMFAFGFAWMRRLAGGEPAEPFLVRPGARVGDSELRVVGALTGLSASEAEELAANRDAVSDPSAAAGERR